MALPKDPHLVKRMKFFSLIFKDQEVVPNKKVLSPDAYTTVLNAQELLEKTQEDCDAYTQHTHEECANLRAEAKNQGFQEGSEAWSKQLAFLITETQAMRDQIKSSLVPLAIASVKKIIGKKLETKPETVVSIISESLKELTQNKRIVIHINPQDLAIVEQHRPELKKLVEYADVLLLSPKASVSPGGCIIETETGIVNAQLDVQLAALEQAFSAALKQKQPTETFSTDQTQSKEG